jgi:GTP-binding protein HflX
MLTDTVGFIDRLPLTLIEAFHSTLEETIYSDLILLVVDASEPMHVINKKLAVCHETIEQIEASGVPIITVLNKIDKIDQTTLNNITEQLQNIATKIVSISALHRTNIDSLKKEILNAVQNYVKASLTIPIKNETMTFISWLYKNANVEKITYTGNSAEIIFEAPPTIAEKVRSRVQQMNGQFQKTQR